MTRSAPAVRLVVGPPAAAPLPTRTLVAARRSDVPRNRPERCRPRRRTPRGSRVAAAPVPPLRLERRRHRPARRAARRSLGRRPRLARRRSPVGCPPVVVRRTPRLRRSGAPPGPGRHRRPDGRQQRRRRSPGLGRRRAAARLRRNPDGGVGIPETAPTPTSLPCARAGSASLGSSGNGSTGFRMRHPHRRPNPCPEALSPSVGIGALHASPLISSAGGRHLPPPASVGKGHTSAAGPPYPTHPATEPPLGRHPVGPFPDRLGDAPPAPAQRRGAGQRAVSLAQERSRRGDTSRWNPARSPGFRIRRCRRCARRGRRAARRRTGLGRAPSARSPPRGRC